MAMKNLYYVDFNIKENRIEFVNEERTDAFFIPVKMFEENSLTNISRLFYLREKELNGIK